MYRWFIEDGLREIEIADRLNTKCIRTDFGREWTRSTVHQVLTKEKYIGNNVYNRMSFTLKQHRIKNPPDMFIRANSIVDPIIDIEQFVRAQEIIVTRCRRYTDDELLEFLKSLWRQHGRLTALIIDEQAKLLDPVIELTRGDAEIAGGLGLRLLPGERELDRLLLELNRRVFPGHGYLAVVHCSSPVAWCPLNRGNFTPLPDGSDGGVLYRGVIV